MLTRDEVEGLHNCREFFHASSVYIRLCKQRKIVFYCFYKINFKSKPFSIEGLNGVVSFTVIG